MCYHDLPLAGTLIEPISETSATHLKQRERRHRVSLTALRTLIPHADFELDLDLTRAAGKHVDAGAERALRASEREKESKEHHPRMGAYMQKI